MTLQMREQEIREESLKKGIGIGMKKGREEGRQEGIQKGREEGIQKGRQEGIQKGIENLIFSLKNCNLPQDVIIEQLVKFYHLDRKQAESYLSS